MWDSLGIGKGVDGERNEPRIIIEIAHTADPNFNQNLFPLIFTKINMKEIAENSFISPNIPVRNRLDDIELKPADMKMTGASVYQILISKEEGKERKREK